VLTTFQLFPNLSCESCHKKLLVITQKVPNLQKITRCHCTFQLISDFNLSERSTRYFVREVTARCFYLPAAFNLSLPEEAARYL
jgi:hypothetical protein